MSQYEAAMHNAVEKNIQRYTRLLRTKLTPLEEQFVRRRLAEDRMELRRLRKVRDGTESIISSTTLLGSPSGCESRKQRVQSSAAANPL